MTDSQCQEWRTGESCCEGGRCCDLPLTTSGLSDLSLTTPSLRDLPLTTPGLRDYQSVIPIIYSNSTETFYKGNCYFQRSLFNNSDKQQSVSAIELSGISVCIIVLYFIYIIYLYLYYLIYIFLPPIPYMYKND